MSDPIVIVSVARTPMGSMLGSLSGLSAHELGAVAIKAAIERAGLKPEQVDEVIMGNVLQAGQGQAPARQAALGAGLPLGVNCSTIHKVCGSGLKAAMFGHDLILAGSAEVVVAGGQESMSNAPYLLLKGRQGYRYGHNTVYDHMALMVWKMPMIAARPWAYSPKTAPTNTTSAANNRTPIRWSRCAARAQPLKTAASNGKSRRSPWLAARATP